MSDWISTDLELPKCQKDVMIVDPYQGVQIAQLIRLSNKKYWIWEGGEFTLKRIKYWQHLPALPSL